MMYMKPARKSKTRKNISLFLRGLLFFVVIFYFTSVKERGQSDALSGGVNSFARKLMSNGTEEKCDPLEKELANQPRLPDLFTAEQLRNGAFLVYIPGVMYMFLGLSIVCDEFFVPALEAAGEAWQLSNDVAGATLMAAGGSAPELATSFIGTFMGSDIGFGTIVGSAVFNVLFVIAMCVIYSPSVLQLTWYPLFRDCLIYAISLALLAIFFAVVSPNKIETIEALILILFYLFYVFLMSQNEKIKAVVMKSDPVLSDNMELKSRNPKKPEEDEKSEAYLLKNPEVEKDPVMGNFGGGLLSLYFGGRTLSDVASIHVVARIQGDVKKTFNELDLDHDGTLNIGELKNLLNKCSSCEITKEQVEAFQKELDGDKDGLISLEEFQRWYVTSEIRINSEITEIFKKYDEDNDNTISKVELKPLLDDAIGKESNNELVDEVMAKIDIDGDGKITKDEFQKWYSDSKFFQTRKRGLEQDADAFEGCNLDMPEGGFCVKLKYFIVLPLLAPMYYTCPNVHNPKLRKWWPWSFFMSIVWIGVFSYFMVQWATVLGLSIKIPTKIMGLIFVAAGTSIPDLLSSVVVCLKGNGDMAVSSSIGSNIFDVLIGLPLPWLVKSALDGPITVGSDDDNVARSVLILLGMLLIVIGSIAFVGWKMDRKLATIFIVFYIIYLGQELIAYYSSDHADC